MILDHVVERERGAGRFENLRTGQPAAVYFWYVESHEPSAQYLKNAKR